MANSIGSDKRLQYVEAQSHPDWFVTTENAEGKREVFLRLQVTGFHPRGVGPFQSEEEALEVLDGVLCNVEQALTDCLDDNQELHCIAEDVLNARYLSALNVERTLKAV